jgi:hypothetical protein
MQVNGPPYPQLDLPTALAVFVNADLLPVNQLAVVKQARFAIEYIVYKAFDLQAVR